jgi:hypothetical protein
MESRSVVPDRAPPPIIIGVSVNIRFSFLRPRAIISGTKVRLKLVIIGKRRAKFASKIKELSD